MTTLHDICSIAMNAETPADSEAILKEWIEKEVIGKDVRRKPYKGLEAINGVNTLITYGNMIKAEQRTKLNNTIKE